MQKEELRIVYMGTPDFAVESLKALVEGGYNVAGVVTTPDRFVGRHMSEPRPCAVKTYALSQQIPVLAPDKLRDEDFLRALRNWQADLQIVVAFRMLPEVVWDMPRFGTFNLHASLLPQYRGAAPINWAVINGESETGVTTFFLTHEIDTGHIILQRRMSIAPTDNASDIHDRLMTLGASTVLQTVDLILEGKAESTPQEAFIDNTTPLRPAPKIFKDTCRIDWNKPAAQVCNLIRGLYSHNAAWTELVAPDGSRQTLKIYHAEIVDQPRNYAPGTLLPTGKKQLHAATANGVVSLRIVQLAGKKQMPVADFLNGNPGIENYSLL